MSGLAIFGGTPERSKPFPSWPVFDDSEEKALLEVRASNLTALQFYERHHFHATGRRAGYYTAPLDDALVLALKLT